VVEGLAVDMRYFGTDNFVGARIDGYEAPRCLLARRAVAALAAVQRDLAGRGFGLKVFDCYRPVRAVAHFVRWAHDATDVARKAEYYPDIDKRDLFRLGYIAERSGEPFPHTYFDFPGAVRLTPSSVLAFSGHAVDQLA
jgi:D-alanyl-D-alanine dipeptidase